MYPSLLVLIIATEGDKFYEQCEVQWRRRMQHYKKVFPTLEYYFLKCKLELETSYEIVGDSFYVKGPESIVPGIGIKTMKAFEILSPQYDFTLRTNISSIFLMGRYFEWLKTASKTNLYAGPLEPFNAVQPLWAFGAGYTISKDVAEKIAESSREIKVTFAEQSGTIEDVFDDVYVGHVCLQHLKLKIQPCLVAQFLHASQLEYLENVIDNNPNLFHVRLKLNENREKELKGHEQVYEKYVTKVRRI